MKRYAASMTAAKANGREVTVHNTTGSVEAASQAEAEGLAWRECSRIYPQRSGWRNHALSVCEVDSLVSLSRFPEQP